MAVQDRSLFEMLCNEAGQVAGLLIKPVNKPQASSEPTIEEVSRKETVEERQVSETVILRRTVIEEVHIKRQ